VAGGAPLRIDRRPDEHQWSHAAGQVHGELGDDLAAHRVRHERWTLETGRVEASGERGGKIRDTEWGAGPLTTPIARQVRCEHGEGRRERLREREHVCARDPVPMHEHHGRPFSTHTRMDSEPKYFEPAALNRPVNTVSRPTVGRRPQRVRGSRHRVRGSTSFDSSIIPTGRCWVQSALISST
jgi:hypothetical protein